MESPSNLLTHVTLNTSHADVVDLGSVEEFTIKLLKPLVLHGSGNLPAPWAAYRVTFARFQNGDASVGVFSFFRGREPITTNYWAFDSLQAYALWRIAIQTYSKTWESCGGGTLYNLGNPPERIPWMATHIWPTAGLVPESDLMAMPDAARCLVATLRKLIYFHRD